MAEPSLEVAVDVVLSDGRDYFFLRPFSGLREEDVMLPPSRRLERSLLAGK